MTVNYPPMSSAFNHPTNTTPLFGIISYPRVNVKYSKTVIIFINVDH